MEREQSWIPGGWFDNYHSNMGAMMIQIWEQGQTKLMMISSIKLVGGKSSWYKKIRNI